MFGLLCTPVEQLGYVKFEVPGWTLTAGLGKGRFSAVYACKEKEGERVCAVKIFLSENTMAMCKNEFNILHRLSNNSVSNIPTSVFHCTRPELSFSALVVTPIGDPILPCPLTAAITPAILKALLCALQSAHLLGIVHRDVKPDNIYLDRSDHSRVILNDWSSAATLGKECDWVGTRMFSDAPDGRGKHIPSAALDLRSLVRTAYCLARQRYPPNSQGDGDYDEFWRSISHSYTVYEDALRFATNVNYTSLSELFESFW